MHWNSQGEQTWPTEAEIAEAFLGKKIKDVVVPVVMVAKDEESGRIDEELRPAAAPWCRSLL